MILKSSAMLPLKVFVVVAFLLYVVFPTTASAAYRKTDMHVLSTKSLLIFGAGVVAVCSVVFLVSKQAKKPEWPRQERERDKEDSTDTASLQYLESTHGLSSRRASVGRLLEGGKVPPGRGYHRGEWSEALLYTDGLVGQPTMLRVLVIDAP